VVTKSTDSAAASGRQGFNYLFYIDFVGALSNPNCQNALRHLQVRQADSRDRWSDGVHCTCRAHGKSIGVSAVCSAQCLPVAVLCLWLFWFLVIEKLLDPFASESPNRIPSDAEGAGGAAAAVAALQESAPFMRVLGSYPMETDLGRLDSNTPFDSINEG
jgi:hypothetical protein